MHWTLETQVEATEYKHYVKHKEYRSSRCNYSFLPKMNEN